jgi:uncharacterized protein YceH (UPF0502 family)
VSRLNTLASGSAEDVANELGDQPATADELRYALINALDRIERLERKLADLKRRQDFDL